MGFFFGPKPVLSGQWLPTTTIQKFRAYRLTPFILKPIQTRVCMGFSFCGKPDPVGVVGADVIRDRSRTGSWL